MIGIIGGTFDPPHWGHLKLAANFVELLRLDELIWLPAGQPWQKSSTITPSQIRFGLTNAIAADLDDYLKDRGIKIQSSVSRLELDREGPSYTIDTAKELRAIYGENKPLIWLMGADSFRNIASWNQWQELPNYLHLAVANRSTKNGENEIPGDVLKSFSKRIVTDHTLLGSQPAGYVFFDNSFHVDLSSTELRNQLLTGLSDQKMQEAIPPRVMDMILALEIYTKKTTP